jgi:hypothetical protein
MLVAVECRRTRGTVTTRTSFTDETAPCGRLVAGTRYSDRDEEGLVVEHIHYGCGCQDFRDNFHDGSIRRRVRHHSGKVLVDEELRGQ